METAMAHAPLPPHLAVHGTQRARLMNMLHGHCMVFCPDLAMARRGGLAVKDLAEPLQRFVRAFSTPTVARAGNAAFVRIDGPLCNEAGWLYDSIEAITHEALVRVLEGLLADPSVSTIVLDMNCPGWSSDGSADVLTTLKRVRANKRLLARVHDMAASGGMWMAAATEEISASPTSWVGSIGSLIYLWDTSAAFKEAGITPVVIASDPDKACGYPGVEPTESWKAMLQRIVDQHSEAFFADVARARGISTDEIKGMKAGMFTAKDALEKKLIDRIEETDAYVARVAALPAKVTQPAPAGPSGPAQKGPRMDLTALTIEQLAQSRPDLVSAIAAKTAQELVAKAKEPATFAQLKEAFGTDKDFIVDCQEKSLSLADARAAYSKALTDKLAAANAKIAEFEKNAAVKPKATGVDPLPEGNAPTSGAKSKHPFLAKVEAYAKEKSVSMGAALASVSKQDPEAHREYLKSSQPKSAR